MDLYQSGETRFQLNIDRPPSLRDRVYEQLREAILSGLIVPGATLLQEQLAEQMGVSRTPIRDALDRLASEGLVTRGAGGRVSVSELSFQEIHEKYAVRQVLEGLALRLAFERIGERQLARLQSYLFDMQAAVEQNDWLAITEIGCDFHDTIIASCGNTFLVQSLQILNDSIRRYRRVAANMPGRAVETLREHELVFAALQRGDVEAADELIQAHIARSQQQLETAIKAYKQRIADGDGAG